MLIRKSLVALIAAIFVLTSLPGCILDPKESVEEEKTPPVKWPDRTDKEDCSEIILLVYQTEDIEKLREVLLKPETHPDFGAGYIWYNQDNDYNTGKVTELSYNYFTELELTEALLANEISLELRLFNEEVEEIPEFRGKPCTDCWQYKYDYHIEGEVMTPDGEKRFVGDFFIQWIIGPDPENEGKYVIYNASDLDPGA